MKDVRCTACDRLLARAHGEATLAVKCPRCKTINNVSLTSALSATPDRRRAAGDAHERP